MNEKCRLCLEDVKCATPTLITDDILKLKLAQVFIFSIAAESALPVGVCRQCCAKVSDFHTFTQLVEANQHRLRSNAMKYELAFSGDVKEEPSYDTDFHETETAEEELIAIERVDIKNEPLSGDSSAVEHDLESSSDEEPKPRSKKTRRKAKQGDLEPSSKSKNKDKPDGESLIKQQEKDREIKDFFTLECEICSISLEDFVQLQEHYLQKHETRGYIRCCNKQFFQRYTLLDHIAVHRGTIRCEICNKSYKTRRYLALHIAKSHGTENERPFKCEKCGMGFPKQYLLRSHELMHVQVECDICKKILSSQHALKVHVSQMHSDNSNHICATCGKMFRTKIAMDRHIKEHLGVELVERMQCTYCQKWFNGKYNLQKHVRFLHKEKGQVFRCDLCSHESPNSRALTYHKQRVHVQEKHECEHCGKRFKRKLYLREHVASHTNNPLYTCEFCGMKFNSHANHFTHRKNKHPEQWEAHKSMKQKKEMIQEFHQFTLHVQSNQELLQRDLFGQDGSSLENVTGTADAEQFTQVPKTDVYVDSTTRFFGSSGVSMTIDEMAMQKPDEETHAAHDTRVVPQEVTTCKVRDSEDSTDAEQNLPNRLHEHDRIIGQFFEMHCELCPADSMQHFDRLLLLQQHYRRRHHCRGYVRCCGKQFFRRFRVIEHIASHRGTIRCEVCEKSFNSKTYLLRHMTRKHVDALKPRSFACEHCKRTYHTEKELAIHKPTHDTVECQICGKTVQARYIKMHVAQIHCGERTKHMCHQCGTNLSSESALQRHIKKHAGVDSIEKLQCSYCGKWLNGKYNLKKHVRCMHLEPGQQFRCGVCGHDSPNSVALENHKKRVHSGTNYVCEQCEKRFKRKVYLTEHVAAFHTHKPLYGCEFCSTTFNSKANYYNHRKTRHPLEWKMQKEEKEMQSRSKANEVLE
ncbi:transcription factor grauzone-like [Anopheles nili]|uniref:transcription factor grauzone-like n=1 Tax=Anopheles nili TaxID=185578 RepID=UPI00237BA1E5|nr:transcription factor grauzone-like [Anopheles nili]